MSTILSDFGNVLNTMFPKGLAGEMIFADLAGGKSRKADSNDLVDLKAHLVTHEKHFETSQLSDPVNVFVNQIDSDVNFIFALFTVARIQNPQLRQQGINLTLQSLSKNGFALFSFD